MPIYSPTGFLDITNATLRTSNVEAENLLMTGGNIYVTSELETDATVLNLENVTRKGNVSSNTIEITNVTTGIVATGNVHASKFIGSGSHLTGIPPSAITGTLSQWSDGTNGDVYIASNVGIGNVHTLTSNTLQVGGNLYVRDTGSNVLTVNGNVVANYFEGDGSKLSGIVTDLQGVTDNGNVTTNVVQFSNVTTGLVTTANIEVGGDLKIDGLTAGTVPYVAADKFLKDSFITTTGDTTVITSNLDVTGNIFMRGDKFIVNSESKLINDAIIGIANNNTVSTTDKGIIMQNTAGNVAIIHHGTGDGFADQLTFGYTDDPLDTVTVTNDLTKELTVNVLGNVITQNNLSVGGTLSINNITAAAQHSLQAVTNVGNVTSNTVQFSNAITSLTASSNIVATGNVSAGYDTNTTSYFGRAAVGYMGQNNQASFAHVSHNTTSSYALKQTATGPTYINTPASGHIRFTVNDGNSGAEKMRITSAGKVGIGESTPDATLHVTGNAYVSSNLTVSGNVEVGTADLFVDTVNSRIGVGTASPHALLHVSGPTGIPAILTSGANDSEGDIAVPTNQNLQIGHWDNGTSTFTNRFYISSSGNIGIGTTSPEQKLEVHGNMLLGQNQVKSYIHGGNSMAVSSDADVLIVADSNDTSGAVGSNSIIFGAGSAIDTDNRNFTYAQAYPNDVPRVELMRLTAEAIEGEAGRLGVGTASPEEKIHFHANHEYLYQRFSTTANSTTEKFDIAQWHSSRSNGDHGVMFNNRANSDMRFITNGAEVMRLKTDKKVGIGTSSPDEKLHIYDNSSDPVYIKITGNTSDRAGIQFSEDTNHQATIEYDGTGSGTGNYLAFYSGATNWSAKGTGLNFIPENGRVGINTTSPETALHVNGSITVGDIGAPSGMNYTDAQLILGGTHNQSSGYNNTDQVKLLITGGNNDGNSPYYMLCEDENTRVQFYVKGATTDNTGNGKVYMRGWLRVQGTGGSISGATTHAGFLYSHTSLQRWNGNHSNVGIFADDDIMTKGYILAINGTFSASDRRIKKDITDIDDGEALQSLRQLQPKKYKYKDTYNKPSDTVWGFIAQDVRETIPNSTQLRTECIPNINEVATVSGTNVITFTDFDTSNLEIGTIIRVHDDGNAAHEIKVTDIIDARSVQVEEDVSKWARSFNEDGTMGEGNGLYVYGQQVDDFVFIKKDAIWTVAVAAVQEIDRQLQAEKTKVATLETQLASVLARLDALENA